MRAQGSRLRLEFLNMSLQSSQTLSSLGKADRDMGLEDAALRCFHLALRGCRSALFLLAAVPHLDEDSESIRGRLESLDTELHSLVAGKIEAIAQPAVVATGPEPAPLEELTQREVQVLRLIADGYSTKQVGAKLGITFKTAACHRDRIMHKLGAPNAAMLVRLAIRLRIVSA